MSIFWLRFVDREDVFPVSSKQTVVTSGLFSLGKPFLQLAYFYIIFFKVSETIDPSCTKALFL